MADDAAGDAAARLTDPTETTMTVKHTVMTAANMRGTIGHPCITGLVLGGGFCRGGGCVRADDWIVVERVLERVVGAPPVAIRLPTALGGGAGGLTPLRRLSGCRKASGSSGAGLDGPDDSGDSAASASAGGIGEPRGSGSERLGRA